MATTTKKDTSPPARPPAPKISRLRGKQTSLSSMAVSFKSLDNENDEDYLNVFTSNTADKKITSKDNDLFGEPNVCTPLTHNHEVKTPIKNSKSLDETGFLKNNRFSKSGPKPEKRTLLSEIKGKLSDKFPDTYNAIAKKLEEFTNDSATSNSSSTESRLPVVEDDDSQNLPKTHDAKEKDVKSQDASEEKLFLSIDSVDAADECKTTIKCEETIPCDDEKDVSTTDIDDPVKDETPLTKDITLTEAFHDPLKNIPEDQLDEINSDIDEPFTQQSTKPTKPDSLPLPLNENFYNCEVSKDMRNVSENNTTIRKRIVSAKTTPSNCVTMSSLLSDDKTIEEPETVVHFKTVIDTTEKPADLSDVCDMNIKVSEHKEDATIARGSQISPKSAGLSEGDASHISDNTLSRVSSKYIHTILPHNPTWRRVILVCLAFFIYYILPMSQFVHGVLVGGMVVSCVFGVLWWANQPRRHTERMVLIKPLEELSPMVVPEMKEAMVDHGKYKGWMNEIDTYNEYDYHINQTMSVYVRLEDTSIRLSRPDVNIPKRASWDEVIPHPKFIHQRHLQLRGSKVYLQPPGLIAKRVWSKKYPICVKLVKQDVTVQESPVTTPHDNDQGFTPIKDDILYLFARTGKEKEMWYHRLSAAAKGQPLKNYIREIRNSIASKPRPLDSRLKQSVPEDRGAAMGILGQDNSPTATLSPMDAVNDWFEDESHVVDSDLEAYAHYMSRLMPQSDNTDSPTTPETPKGKSKDRRHKDCISCEPQLIWLNALAGRCFWEFLWTNYWASKVKDKIQKKISKIRVPYFIDELKITDIHMGNDMPVIRRATKPYLDEEGFWVNLDIAYSGGFYMMVETKMNLLKLKKVNEKELAPVKTSVKASHNSEEEDSAESSTDDDEETAAAGVEDSPQQGQGQQHQLGGGKSRKIVRYIDKIAKSKYFQQATEYKYIKKAMEGVSNTRIILNVEVKKLVGTLAVNIPHPPSDRLWYGFKDNPQLSLVAKPKLGEREVNVSQLSEWIENKLAIEFQRVFVMPNMDDLIVPLLIPGYTDAADKPSSASSSPAKVNLT